MLAEPNVNGGKYFALIDGLNISVFYSRNSINELHLHTFSECKEEVNEAGRLPMFEVKVFCKESLKSSFSGFGIFRIGVKECVCKKLDEEILSAARKFWEDISRSASEESYVVHAQKKGALSDGESFQ